MKTKAYWEKIIDKNNQSQLAWIFHYLWNHDVRMTPLPDGGLNRSNLIKALIELPKNPVNELGLRKMLNAIHAKKWREKESGRKSYSILMNITTRKILEKMAKDQNLAIYELLDRLVLEEAHRASKGKLIDTVKRVAVRMAREANN